MKKYVLTSKSFTGSVEFGYNENGSLVFYHNAADMSDKQQVWLLQHLPPNEIYLMQVKNVIKGELKEVPQDLNFDTFWDKYDKKINRKRCEPMWRKMSDAEKLQAISNIKAYDNYLERTNFRGKADPENYLKKEYYQVDWKREK